MGMTRYAADELRRRKESANRVLPYKIRKHGEGSAEEKTKMRNSAVTPPRGNKGKNR